MQNWEYKNLEEVCEINIGRTPERGTVSNWDKNKETNNVWLSIADLNNSENGYISDSTEYVSDKAVPKMKLVRANTLLMSFKLTIGRCAITGIDLYTNEAIAALPIKNENELDLFYLKYYLEMFDWNKLTEGDVKVKGKTLNKEKLKTIPILLPPLEEQKRIVKILDEKIAMLETVKANAKTNLQNAKDLFHSQLTKAFSNTTWEKKTVLEVCTNIVDCPHTTPKKVNNKTDFPCIRTSELKDGFIFWDSMQYLDEEEYKKRVARLQPQENDIVFGREGSVGGAILIPHEFHFSLGQRTMLLRPNQNIIYPKYFLQVIISDFFRKQIREKITPGGVPHINVADVKSLNVLLPPLPEQKLIVEQLDSLSEKVRSLEEIYTKQLANCDELKQAFLAKAFNGEL